MMIGAHWASFGKVETLGVGVVGVCGSCSPPPSSKGGATAERSPRTSHGLAWTCERTSMTVWGAPRPPGVLVPIGAACIKDGLYKVLKPSPWLLTCSPVKSACMGVGDPMMGLEELFLGYGPWVGGIWLYPKIVGCFSQKPGHAGGAPMVRAMQLSFMAHSSTTKGVMPGHC